MIKYLFGRAVSSRPWLLFDILWRCCSADGLDCLARPVTEVVGRSDKIDQSFSGGHLFAETGRILIVWAVLENKI